MVDVPKGAAVPADHKKSAAQIEAEGDETVEITFKGDTYIFAASMEEADGDVLDAIDLRLMSLTCNVRDISLRSIASSTSPSASSMLAAKMYVSPLNVISTVSSPSASIWAALFLWSAGTAAPLGTSTIAILLRGVVAFQG